MRCNDRLVVMLKMFFFLFVFESKFLMTVKYIEDTSKYMAKAPFSPMQVLCNQFLYWGLLGHVLQ